MQIALQAGCLLHVSGCSTTARIDILSLQAADSAGTSCHHPGILGWGVQPSLSGGAGRAQPQQGDTEDSATTPRDVLPSPTASLGALCCERCQSARASSRNEMWRSGVPELLF